jgi:uncharacterized membrane protein
MIATTRPTAALLDEFAAELTRAASETVLLHGLRGSSIQLEIDLWRAFRRVLQNERRWARVVASHAATGITRDELLAELTDVAYRTALAHGFRGSFVDVELGLWKSLARTSRNRIANTSFSGFMAINR